MKFVLKMQNYTTNHEDEITSCRMYNAIDETENYLVAVRKLKDYKVPAITEKPEQLPKKRKSEILK